MFVFIDDSGDPGFHFERGSTRLLVVACLVFQGHEQMKRVSEQLAAFRRQSSRSSRSEFKFSRMKPELTAKLLATLSPSDFRVTCVFVDKVLHSETQRTVSSADLYDRLLARAVSGLPEGLGAARLKIDGRGSRRRKLKDFGLAFPPIHSVKYADSRSDELIQLADVFAGCIRRSMDPKEARRQWYLTLLSAFVTDSSDFKDVTHSVK